PCGPTSTATTPPTSPWPRRWTALWSPRTRRSTRPRASTSTSTSADQPPCHPSRLVLGLGDDGGDALGEAGAGQVGRVAPDVAAVLPEVTGAEGEAEVGVQVGGFAGAGVGGDVENLEVDGEGVGFGGGDGAGVGDAGLLQFAQGRGVEAVVVGFDVAAGQEPAVRRRVVDRQHAAGVVDGGDA